MEIIDVIFFSAIDGEGPGPSSVLAAGFFLRKLGRLSVSDYREERFTAQGTELQTPPQRLDEKFGIRVVMFR